MALTGDLQNLPIVDVIQLVHTTRKSGVFSVSGEKGESAIVFSGGYIVDAGHLNNSIHIGSVLVKNGAVTVDDLKQVLEAVKDRGLIIATLIQTGKLRPEDGQKALRKLVELIIVDLMGLTSGTFTFDTDAVPAGPDGPAQEVMLDAQMVLMDALRVFDERERDRAAGKEVPSFEALYAGALPAGLAVGPSTPGAPSAITADILGLADVDRLEKRIPRPMSDMKLFDPLEIHRQKIRELLAGFSAEEQESFVAFLRKATERKPSPEVAARQAGKAVVLFSGDKLFRHAVMTVCKEERIPVFATDDEKDLERLLSQCLSSQRMPVAVFDAPAGAGDGPSGDTIVGLRHRVRRKYPAVPMLQLAPPEDGSFALRSYDDGVTAVLPKPLREARRETFVPDILRFLGTFTSYISAFRSRSDDTDRQVKELKKDVRALREIATPSDAALVMLAAVAEMFERAVTFIVRPSELAGERAAGVSGDKSIGPTAADLLKVPLDGPSVFRAAVDTGAVYFGESGDEALAGFHQQIGAPLRPAFVLLPLVSDKKVVAVVYGDFGKKEAAPVQLDILEVLAQQVGISLEYALFRRQAAKTQKS